MAPKSTSLPTEPPRRSLRLSSKAPPSTEVAAPPAAKKRPAEGQGTEKAASSNGKAAAASGDATSKKAKKEEAVPEGGAAKVGDALPEMTLKDEEENEVRVSDIKNAVVFLYPKANTPGCNTQACTYRDTYEDWKAAGFAVYGLSNDSPKSLASWKAKNKFAYTLLSDPKRDLIKVLTGTAASTKRSHFVIDKDGKVALASVGVKPAESSPAALKFAKAL